MRKIFLTILFFMFLILPSYADFMPVYVDSSIYLGDGVIASKEKITVYKDKNVESEVIAIISGDKIKSKFNSSIENVFLASIKYKNLNLIAANDNDDEWFEVCISQKDKAFGWVKKDDYIDYLSIQNFYNFFGRKNGLYLFRNVKEKDKKLYASPSIDSNVVDSFFYPKYISLWLIAREWMLVKVTTYDGKTKTGWLKWRLDDGSVIVFPILK